MEMSVSEYARQMHVSERRVRQLAVEGRVPARRIGRSWVIDAQGASGPRPGVRPMSPANAWSMARRLSGGEERLLRQDRYRDMVERLRSAERPEELLAAWFAKRAEGCFYTVQPADLEDLRQDPRLRLSGVSHAASGLLAGREVEGYVSRAQLEALVREFLLVPAPVGKGNVLLHVTDDEGEVPVVLVAADLAERSGVRERHAARALLADRLTDA